MATPNPFDALQEEFEAQQTEAPVSTNPFDALQDAYDAQTAELEAEADDQSFLRSLADPFLKIGSGIMTGLEGLSAAYDPTSDTTKMFSDAKKAIIDLVSAQSKLDSREAARLVAEAEGMGELEELKAGVQAWAQNPIDQTLEGVSTAIPVIAASILTGPAAPYTATALGATQGAGFVRKGIYDAVSEELKVHQQAMGLTDAQIDEMAKDAISYTGDNADQIAIAGGLGAWASRTGIEAPILNSIKKRIGKDVVEKATAEAAKKTVKGQALKTGAAEAGTEFIQGGQQKMAENIALQREGFDVPTGKGVVGQGTQEALAGGLGGATVGGVEGYVAGRQTKDIRDIQAVIDQQKQRRDAGLVDEEVTTDDVTDTGTEETGTGVDLGGAELDISGIGAEETAGEPTVSPTDTAGRGVGVPSVPTVADRRGDGRRDAALDEETTLRQQIAKLVDTKQKFGLSEEGELKLFEAINRLEEIAAKPPAAPEITPPATVDVAPMPEVEAEPEITPAAPISSADLGEVGGQAAKGISDNLHKGLWEGYSKNTGAMRNDSMVKRAQRIAQQRGFDFTEEELRNFSNELADAKDMTETVAVEKKYFNKEQEVKPDETVDEQVETPVEPAEGEMLVPEQQQEPKKETRGRKKVERTPEEQAIYDELRSKQQAAQTVANRRGQEAFEVVSTVSAPTGDLTQLSEEDAAVEVGKNSLRLRSLINAQRILNNKELRGTKGYEAAKNTLAHESVTVQERTFAKEQADQLPNTFDGIARLESTSLRQAMPRKSPVLHKMEGKPKLGAGRKRMDDLGAVQTVADGLRIIARKGNAFEKILAKRLMPLVGNVPVIVVTDPVRDLSPEFIGADNFESIVDDFQRGVVTGLVVDQSLMQDTDYAARGTVMVLGDVQPDSHGIHKETFLHEALHVVLGQAITRAQAGVALNPDENALTFAMESVARRAMKAFYNTPPELFDATKYDQIDAAISAFINKDGSINVNEFVSWGMTNRPFMEFLATTEGTMAIETAGTEPSLFTRFVNAILDFFKLNKEQGSGLQDLIAGTDQLLSSVELRQEREALSREFMAMDQEEQMQMLMDKLFPEKPQPSDTRAMYDEDVDPDAVKQGKRIAHKQAQKKRNKVRAATRKTVQSKTATEANASYGELWAGVRSAKDAEELLRATRDTLSVGGIDAALKALTTNGITRIWGDKLPQMEDLRDAIDHMGAFQTKWLKMLEDNVEGWAAYIKANPKDAENLSYIMALSTLEQFDPSEHTTLADALADDEIVFDLRNKEDAILNDPNSSNEQRRTAAAAVSARENLIKEIWNGTEFDGVRVEGWGKLSKRGRFTYKMARDTYAEAFEMYGDILEQSVADSQELPGDANDETTPKGRLMAQITKAMADAKQLGIYFPLQRFGNYWYREGKGQTGQVLFFESATARNLYIKQRMEELGSDINQMMEDGDADAGDNVVELRNYMLANSKMLKDMFQTIDSIDPNTVNQATIDQLKNDIYDLYLRTLPDRDLRKRLQKRKGIAGFSTDALRVFANQMHTTYNQLGRLSYQGEINQNLEGMRDSLEGYGDLQEKLKLTRVVNEVERRANAELRPSQDGFLDKAAALGNKAVFYYMLSSIKSALVQLTQLATVGAPVLTSKYGTTATLGMMGRYGNLFNVMGRQTREYDGEVVTKFDMPDMANSDRVKNDPNLSFAWQWGDNNNIFMNTYAGTLTSRTRMPTDKYEGKKNKVSRAIFGLMSGFFHHAERTSRQIMFMSAFELEFNRLTKAGATPEQARQKAVRVAKDLTQQAMFDYTEINKPSLMKPPVMRVATQFMTYPIQMASYLMRNAATLPQFFLKNGDREAAKESAIQLTGTLGMTFTLAGTVGMPLYSLAMGMWDAIIKENFQCESGDTDPYCKVPTNIYFENVYVPSVFGPGSDLAQSMGLDDEAANTMRLAMMYGPLSAMTDQNWSASISLSDLFFRADVPGDNYRAAWKELVYTYGLGAFGSMTQQGLAAIDDFERGDFYRGMEKITPAFYRGIIKSMRLADEGERTPTELVQIKDPEWFHTGKLISQSLGFNSLEMADIQRKNFQAKKFMRKISSDRSKVLKDVNQALVRSISNPDDPKYQEAFKAAIAAAIEWNRETGYIYPITAEQLLKSLQTKAGRRAKALNGLVVEKSFYPTMGAILSGELAKQKAAE